MSSKLYNGFSSLWPGFHRPLFDFLAERITDAVVIAAEDARKNGMLRHRVALHAGSLTELLRNRAIDAFFRNPEAASLLLPPACSTPCDLGAVRYRAVDPTLTVLELLREKDGVSKRIGLLVFFAVHSTALSHENPLYASDFTGWAMTRLSARPKQADRPSSPASSTVRKEMSLRGGYGRTGRTPSDSAPFSPTPSSGRSSLPRTKTTHPSSSP